jgi:uncharacterized membrane protein
LSSYVFDWLNLLVRWFHFTAGIAWIGASFYFVWLDNNLELAARAEDKARGIHGDLWAVHGGGFYHNQKYLTGPRDEPLSTHLHWFYWEAYSTLLSGIGLLAIVYWVGASTYLIDPSVLALSVPAAIGISIGSLIAGWLIYDALCRVLERQPRVLAATVVAFLLLADYLLFHTFSARAAYLHVGAIVGTIMVLNVFFVIIPGQRTMVATLRAGGTPDPRPGRLAKTRSVHNTYFTLPVLFIMISNHFPITYGSPYGWLVLAVLALAAVCVRQFYLFTHKHRYVPALLGAAALLIVGTAVAVAPHPPAVAGVGTAVAAVPAPRYAQIAPIVAQRCAVCHAAHPIFAGYTTAPAGVLLDTPARIVANAERIKSMAVDSHAMPIGNLTNITDAERATLGSWIAAGAHGP